MQQEFNSIETTKININVLIRVFYDPPKLGCLFLSGNGVTS